MEKRTVATIFNEVATFTEDPFWKDIFKNCEKGKFPKGVFYDKKTFDVRYGKTCINIFDTPVQDLYEKLYDIFQKCGNRSTTDDRILEERLETTKTIAVSLDCEWKDISPKQYQHVLLQEYIDRLCNSHNITDAKKKDNLYAQLCIFIKFKTVKNENIIYKDREIVDIDNLEFDENRAVFTNSVKYSNPIKVVRTHNDAFLKALRKFGKSMK